MTFTNPLINALLAAVLGIFFVVYWSWHDEISHKTLIFVAIACAVLGYYFGEPFVSFLMRIL
jgi:hypothetical protein